MLEDLLFNRTKQPLLEKALNAYSMRLRVISNNIANISTEGYKRKAVSFEDKLVEAYNASKLSGLRTTDDHIKLGKDNLDGVEPEVVVPEDDFSNGINNVDIDHEMIELGKVQINNAVIARSMAGFFGTIDAAIKGQRTR